MAWALCDAWSQPLGWASIAALHTYKTGLRKILKMQVKLYEELAQMTTDWHLWRYFFHIYYLWPHEEFSEQFAKEEEILVWFADFFLHNTTLKWTAIALQPHSKKTLQKQWSEDSWGTEPRTGHRLFTFPKSRDGQRDGSPPIPGIWLLVWLHGQDLAWKSSFRTWLED